MCVPLLKRFKFRFFAFRRVIPSFFFVIPSYAGLRSSFNFCFSRPVFILCDGSIIVILMENLLERKDMEERVRGGGKRVGRGERESRFKKQAFSLPPFF
jgi:hypothetical protein